MYILQLFVPLLRRQFIFALKTPYFFGCYSHPRFMCFFSIFSRNIKIFLKSFNHQNILWHPIAFSFAYLCAAAIFYRFLKFNMISLDLLCRDTSLLCIICYLILVSSLRVALSILFKFFSKLRTHIFA